MVMFPVNPQRMDPYKNFKFRLRWEGRYVAALSKVSSLKMSVEAIKFREGGDPSTTRVSPGQASYDPITLERGLTLDTEFEAWMRQIWNFGSGFGRQVALANYRRDVTLEFYNEAGQLVIGYNIFRCWPSQYQAMPDLDAGGNAVAIQTLVLQNEGWQRDTGLEPPPEPSFN